MLPVTFNVNDYAKVKLTPEGIKILKKQHEALRHLVGFTREFDLKIDAQGYYKTQMWDLMQTFGPHISLGKKVPFETNIILCLEV